MLGVLLAVYKKEIFKWIKNKGIIMFFFCAVIGSVVICAGDVVFLKLLTAIVFIL